MKKAGYFFSIGCISFFLFAFTHISVQKGDAPGTIQFIGDAGQATTFTVTDWHFTHFAMKDNNPENVEVEIEMETASIQANWKELVESIKKKKEYFYVKSFPKAKVSIKGATRNADNTYQAQALITLKSITKPVTLTFTISDTKPYVVKGKGSILRHDFGFTGDGPIEEVPLMFEATLPLEKDQK